MRRPPTSARRSGWRGKRCRVDCAGERSSSSPPLAGEWRAQRCQRGQVFRRRASVEAAPPPYPPPQAGEGKKGSAMEGSDAQQTLGVAGQDLGFVLVRTTARFCHPVDCRAGSSERTASRPRTGCGRRPFSMTQHNSAGLEKLPLVRDVIVAAERCRESSEISWPGRLSACSRCARPETARSRRDGRG